KEGRSVFLSSHLLHDTEQLCENLVILKDGKLFYQGSTREILKSINSQYKISYLEKGMQKTFFEDDQNQMQARLKELISNDCVVEKVEQDRITLEEYFVKNVLEKRDEIDLGNS
ncbi:MAG: hypothetical protein KDD40_03470, partial [Bdellovibrionales bacterium]|nr:hypothetical protein [Bdellovibrionales bacterium]